MIATSNGFNNLTPVNPSFKLQPVIDNFVPPTPKDPAAKAAKK